MIHSDALHIVMALYYFMLYLPLISHGFGHVTELTQRPFSSYIALKCHTAVPGWKSDRIRKSLFTWENDLHLWCLDVLQDGCVLCSWAGRHQRAPPPQLHVLSVLGRDGHQRAPWESLQGLQVQQLLHGSAAPHPLPQSVTCRLYHHDPAALIRLRTLQVTTHDKKTQQNTEL